MTHLWLDPASWELLQHVVGLAAIGLCICLICGLVPLLLIEFVAIVRRWLEAEEDDAEPRQ